MSVYHTVVHKAQFIANLTAEACESPDIDNIAKSFDADVLAILGKEFYKKVEIDKDYKRYALDFGLVSDCKEKLSDACHDIAILTRTNPNLKDVEFDAL